MSNSEHAEHKQVVHRVKRARLKYIRILPSLVTILNGLAGLAAIVNTGKGQFAEAGFFVLLAMVADMLDGRLARMSQSTSSFGGQLDSLCDVVSFGAAPAYLMMRLANVTLERVWEAGAGTVFMQRFIMIAAAVYFACAAIRLARFNVENEEDESAHMNFVGLPSPAAAGVVISIVLLKLELFTHIDAGSAVGTAVDAVMLFILPIFTFTAGILMISRISYPHVVNQYIRGKKPFNQLIQLLLALALVIWSIQIALVLVFCGFAAWGLLRWLIRKLKFKTLPVVQPAGTPPQSE